jgi:hypothetical protein
LPRYYFNVRHNTAESDGEGSELADIQAARLAAVRLSGELIQELDHSFWDSPDWRLEVTDAGQNTLFTLTFCAKEHDPG